jgi:hypothetical protein
MIEVLRTQQGREIRLYREEVVVERWTSGRNGFPVVQSGSIGTHLLRRESCGKV